METSVLDDSMATPLTTSTTDTAAPSTSMEKILDKVVAFVDVHTDKMNVSSATKTVLKSLGAKIARSVTAKATHLVFKEGSFANYTKAKNLNIPIVPLSWIEESKKLGKLADPSEFKINNNFYYDNPQLFEKIKRVRRYTGESKKNTSQKGAPHKTGILTSTPKSGKKLAKKRTNNGDAFSEVNSENELLRGHELSMLNSSDNRQTPIKAAEIDISKKRGILYAPMVINSKCRKINTSSGGPSSVGYSDNSSIFFTPQSSGIKDTSSTTYAYETDDDFITPSSSFSGSLIDNSSRTFGKELQTPLKEKTSNTNGNVL